MLGKAWNYGVDPVAVGERIRFLRKEKRISVCEMQDFFNISRQALYKWESGQNMPNIDNLVALSVYFGVSLEYLLVLNSSSNATEHQQRSCESGGAALIFDTLGAAPASINHQIPLRCKLTKPLQQIIKSLTLGQFQV